ncbi:toll/interleukin-1 receptor domain-containing protein [bacterium]|nr:toll/interleukin-1 receptor domain-containing protein [bacterium]
MDKPTVFISYSHKDEAWKERLVTQLSVLQFQSILDLWDDHRIEAGQDWYEEVQKAMAAARVAILLVSANFLTSKFILSEEVPRLLQRRDQEGLRIFPVILKPCAWKQVNWLVRMLVRPKDGQPLSGGSEHQIDADLAAIAEEVAKIISTSTKNKFSGYYKPEVKDFTLLPYLSDRSKQVYELGRALEYHRSNKSKRPFICIIHGDEKECHDRF